MIRFAAASLLLLPIVVGAQTAQQQSEAAQQKSAAVQSSDYQQPTMRLDFRFPQSNPPEYHLTLRADGSGTFEEPANEKINEFTTQFRVDPSVARELLEEIEATHYLSGSYDFTKHKVADTGEKHLVYSGNGMRGEATFHYTEDPTVQKLTARLQSIAVTQDFGRRLTFDRRFEKLALDADIKRLVEMFNSGQATDMDSIADILKSLMDDSAVLNTVRMRAKELLRRADADAATSKRGSRDTKPLPSDLFQSHPKR